MKVNYKRRSLNKLSSARKQWSDEEVTKLKIGFHQIRVKLQNL